MTAQELSGSTPPPDPAAALIFAALRSPDRDLRRKASAALGDRLRSSRARVAAICAGLGLAVAVSGCDHSKPENEVTLANGYEVARLFTRDGVTVYRFYDRGEWRYFASSGVVSWAERKSEYDPNLKQQKIVSHPRETQTVEVDGGKEAGAK